MTRTRKPRSASAAPRLTAVVDLPTPPFWFAIAMIRALPGRSGAIGAARLDDARRPGADVDAPFEVERDEVVRGAALGPGLLTCES